MATVASWTEQLLTGLAELIDAAGVGRWEQDTVLADGDVPAVCLIELPAEITNVICLTDYPVEDDPSTTDGIVGVQVRTRGGRNPLDARRFADGVFEALHGLHGFVLGELGPYPVTVAHIYRNSATPIGPDSQGRHERSENYYVHVNRASAGRDE